MSNNPANIGITGMFQKFRGARPGAAFTRIMIRFWVFMGVRDEPVRHIEFSEKHRIYPQPGSRPRALSRDLSELAPGEVVMTPQLQRLVESLRSRGNGEASSPPAQI